MRKEWNFKGTNTRRGPRDGNAVASNNPGRQDMVSCWNCGESNMKNDAIVICTKCGETIPRSK